MKRILVVDDDPDILHIISEILSEAGYAVDTIQDGQGAIERLKVEFYDLVITDLNMPEVGGMEVLKFIVSNSPDTVCIILTGYGTIRSSVEAIKMGAFDYLPKPISSEEILVIVEKALKFKRLERENVLLRNQLRKKYKFENFIGTSEAIRQVFNIIEKVANTDSTILITGESGTGKELIARAIHYNSDRRDRPMVTINCGAIPEELLESELFGHEKGAFTGAHRTRIGRFEVADGGTIFLDEIGDMSPNLQVKLLRVIQEQKFERVGSTKTINIDIRIIAATNKNLKKAVSEGHFREDLYYRLNVIPINVPPLRERKSDIPLLVDYFVKRYKKRNKKKIKGFTHQAIKALMRYDWPGNVRELENIVERAVILSDHEEIDLDDIPENIRGGSEPIRTVEISIPDDGIHFSHAVEEYERELILQALNKTNWVKKKAAKLLNISRTTLVEKIKKRNIVKPPTLNRTGT